MRTRLVAYTPFGAQLGVLSQPLESTVVTPLGELPSLTISYPRDGMNASGLEGIAEVGWEFWDGAAWVEPDNCRFLSMGATFDHLDQTATRKYSLVGIGWMLRRARVWDRLPRASWMLAPTCFT